MKDVAKHAVWRAIVPAAAGAVGMVMATGFPNVYAAVCHGGF